MTGGEPPEDGYSGDYVAELAERDRRRGHRRRPTREAVGARGVELVLERVRATLERFGVDFDTWFSERDLYRKGEVEQALARLEAGRPLLPQRRRRSGCARPTSATTRTGC